MRTFEFFLFEIPKKPRAYQRRKKTRKSNNVSLLCDRFLSMSIDSSPVFLLNMQTVFLPKVWLSRALFFSFFLQITFSPLNTIFISTLKLSFTLFFFYFLLQGDIYKAYFLRSVPPYTLVFFTEPRSSSNYMGRKIKCSS